MLSATTWWNPRAAILPKLALVIHNVSISALQRPCLTPMYVASFSYGLTPQPKQAMTIVPSAPTTHSISCIVSLICSLVKESSPCGDTPPVSPALAWPSDLGSSTFSPVIRPATITESVTLPEDIDNFFLNNTSPATPVLASPPLSMPPSPASPTIQQIGHVNIPTGHYMINFDSVAVVLPYEDTVGPYYIITCGQLVGIIARW